MPLYYLGGLSGRDICYSGTSKTALVKVQRLLYEVLESANIRTFQTSTHLGIHILIQDLMEMVIFAGLITFTVRESILLSCVGTWYYITEERMCLLN